MFQRFQLTTFFFCIICTVFAQSDPAITALQNHLKDHHTQLGLSQDDVLQYQVSSHYQSAHTEVSHIYLQQSWSRIPVYNAILNANVSSDDKILSIGNRFVANLVSKVNTDTPVILPSEALVNVLQHFGPAGVQMPKQLAATTLMYSYEAGQVALEPLEVYLQYFPLEDGQVQLVWTVDFYQLDAQHAWRVQVDAVNGNLLHFHDRVVHCNFDRCDATQDPEAALHFKSEAHQQHSSSSLVPNSYNVYPLFIESPSHGERDIVVDPANPLASPFGWHDTNGVAGPEFTITRGNNVHAYHDIFRINQSIGGEPDGGDSLCFDFPHDPAAPPHSQVDAAVVNLFYWNNLVHDVLIYYGFDEASGNFQAHNFTGPDSTANDYVRAEALDGSRTNNANFFTPRDGSRPRMQMFVWETNLPTTQHFTLSVSSPDSLVGDYWYRPVPLGELLLPGDDFTAELVVVQDSVDALTDGCDSIVNAAELNGKAAMIDLENCGIDAKAYFAQEAGATMVILCNTNPDPNEFEVTIDTFSSIVTIPVIGMSKQDCDSLKMGLPGVNISLPTAIFLPDPGPQGLDSDYDNGVIVHEYGHGISNRLTGGPQLSDCLRNDEQAGEGWSDFFGLVFNTTSENTANQARGIATWLSEEPVTGTGLRPFPYSRDMGINPITYDDYASSINPHGTGSIFAATLWDMYWNFVDLYGFDDDLYNGSGGNNMAIQLVIDGMKLQPCSPTFLDARDAIILADSILYDAAHECMLWATFARRGMGVEAEANGIASFESPYICFPYMQVEKVAVSDTLAGDVITYQLDIRNGSRDTIYDAFVTDILPVGATLIESSIDCNYSLDNGVLTIEIGDAPGTAIFNCSYQLTTNPNIFSVTDFEEDTRTFSDWDRENPITEDDWRFRSNVEFSQNRAFFARNLEFTTDQLLIMEDPITLEGSHPGLVIFHQYDTQGGIDGGVIEITTDNGENWADIGASRILENGYQSSLSDTTDNPLAGRPAFHGNSRELIRSAIDLTDFAGQEIKLRFRFATDSLGAGDGWWIDQFNFMSELAIVVNRACTTTDEITICSEAGTLLFPNPNSTNTLLQDRMLDVFPNPSQGLITVSVPDLLAEQVNLQILSIDGKVQRDLQYDSFLREQISLDDIAAGVYLLKFSTSAGVTTRKVVLQ